MGQEASAVVYKDIPGLPGYRAGSDGTIWSCLGTVCRGPGRVTAVMTDSWRQKKQQIDRRGYYTVGLKGPGQKRVKRWYVHQLVLFAFVGPRPDGMECCHGDGNRRNNRLENLRWDTHAGNMADTARHGSQRGMNNGRAVLTEDDVRAIRLARETERLGPYRLAKRYGVGPDTIKRILAGHHWSHVDGATERDGFRFSSVVRPRKATPEQVAEVRKRHAAGESTRKIAASVGVGRTTVCNIVNRQGVYVE